MKLDNTREYIDSLREIATVNLSMSKSYAHRYTEFSFTVQYLKKDTCMSTKDKVLNGFVDALKKDNIIYSEDSATLFENSSISQYSETMRSGDMPEDAFLFSLKIREREKSYGGISREKSDTNPSNNGYPQEVEIDQWFDSGSNPREAK